LDDAEFIPADQDAFVPQIPSPELDQDVTDSGDQATVREVPPVQSEKSLSLKVIASTFFKLSHSFCQTSYNLHVQT